RSGAGRGAGAAARPPAAAPRAPAGPRPAPARPRPPPGKPPPGRQRLTKVPRKSSPAAAFAAATWASTSLGAVWPEAPPANARAASEAAKSNRFLIGNLLLEVVIVRQILRDSNSREWSAPCANGPGSAWSPALLW